MSEKPSAGLILWDPEVVVDWMARNEAYARLRSRANAGTPALSTQVYAEFLRALRQRRLPESRLADLAVEIGEQFVLLDLTPDRADAFAVASLDLARLANVPFAEQETWFVWQIALCRSEGHRIMTKAPSRYAGLVGRDRLA